MRRASILLIMSLAVCLLAKMGYPEGNYNVAPFVDRTGVESPAINTDRWAVLVGVDDYRQLPDLLFAVNDVAWLAWALIEACQFPQEAVFPLTTEWTQAQTMPPTEGPAIGSEFWEWFARRAQPPTRENLAARLEWLKERCGPEDLILLYFSGHGLQLEGKGYLAPVEADSSAADTLQQTCIPTDELTNLLAQLPARAVVVIFDACRNDPTQARAVGQPEPLGEVLSRSVVVRPLAGAGTEVSATLFSCKVGQQSYEWNEKKHGFFSYFLTKGLLGAAAEEGDQVTLNSLETYLAQEVPAAAEKEVSREQVPWLSREGTDPGSLILAWSGLLPPGTAVPPVEGAEPSRLKTLCVHNFSNISGQARWDHLSLGLAEGIASRLASASGIQIVERALLKQVLKEIGFRQAAPEQEKTLQQLGQLVGADYSLVGSFEPAGGGLKVNARLVNNRDGMVLCGISKSGGNREFLEASLAAEVASALGSSLPEPPDEVGSVPSVASTPVDEAVALFDAGRYAEAFHAFARASEADPDNLNLHRLLEKSARRAGLEQRFLERYTRLVAQHPNNPVLRNYLGNAYLLLDPGDAQRKAREHYEQALRLNPKFAPPLNNLGIIAFRQGNSAAAESFFERYLEAEPGDAPAWVNLGLVYVARVEKEARDAEATRAAHEALQRALQLQPALASVHKALGRLYAATGRKTDALVAFQRSLTLDRGQRDVRQQVELLQWELGSLAAGPAAWDDMETRAALRSGAIAALIAKVAEALSAQRFEEAEVLAKEFCRVVAGNGLAFRLLARAYEGQGRQAEATRALAEANRLLTP